MSPVAEFVIAQLADTLKVPADTIRLESTFRGDLALDSLHMIDLALQAEERFGIRIREQDLRDINTVGDIVKYIEERAAAPSPPGA